MEHHYKEPNLGFGVTSPVWDWVFGESPGSVEGRPEATRGGTQASSLTVTKAGE